MPSSQDITERDLPPCGCLEPGTTNASTCYCGVDDLLRILRRRYSLAVMNAVHTRGRARYHDVAAALPGISSSTLAETLHALEAARLIERHRPDQSPGSSYELTRSGSTLLIRLRGLLTDLDGS